MTFHIHFLNEFLATISKLKKENKELKKQLDLKTKEADHFYQITKEQEQEIDCLKKELANIKPNES